PTLFRSLFVRPKTRAGPGGSRSPRQPLPFPGVIPVATETSRPVAVEEDAVNFVGDAIPLDFDRLNNGLVRGDSLFHRAPTIGGLFGIGDPLASGGEKGHRHAEDCHELLHSAPSRHINPSSAGHRETSHFCRQRAPPRCTPACRTPGSSCAVDQCASYCRACSSLRSSTSSCPSLPSSGTLTRNGLQRRARGPAEIHPSNSLYPIRTLTSRCLTPLCPPHPLVFWRGRIMPRTRG